MLCGISSAFAELFPTRGQVSHVLRTRAPCAHFLYCYRKLRTRLACVKRAASVRSEPGSNSRLKLVAPKIQNPPPVGDGPDFQSELLYSLGHSNRTGSGMCHPVVKERAPLSSRKANRQTEIIEKGLLKVNCILRWETVVCVEI